MSCIKYIFLNLFIVGWIFNLHACTIFSAKAKDGHVWAGNNEDYYLTFRSYLNVVTKTDTSFGYIYFSWWGRAGTPQGGVNEAGLFFDWNALLPGKTIYKDFDKKKDFPGGSVALNHYFMRKCKTVQEVFDIYMQYRDPDLESSQLHLADKYGNLGIIVADSMWITKSNYQVSTNYNVCHPDKDGMICWRFPIAESILRSNEPGLEIFREICDSTSRKTGPCTSYSNIHDLTTGVIWFYFGMDYKKSYKTSINDLLEQGDTSFPFYRLFENEPLVKVYKTYQSEGVKKSLKQLNGYDLPLMRKNEILRLLSLELIACDHKFECFPFLSELMKSSTVDDDFLQRLNAVSLFSIDRKTEAIKELKKYLTVNPTNTKTQVCLDHMQGKYEEGANVKFALNGYKKAKYVFVDYITYPNIKYFLVSKDGNWVGEFKLSPGEVYYTFNVDGKRVLDPKNTNIYTDTGDKDIKYNIINVKN